MQAFLPNTAKIFRITLARMFRIRRSKKILFGIYALYQKRKKRLLPAQAAEIETELKALEKAILERDVKRSAELAEQCRILAKSALKKSSLEHVKDFVLAVGLALLFALVIRQVWFELYEIPTGSMRPTFKEQDRLVVSKTTFGINVPFSTKHLYFDPDLVKRSESVVFSVENMDVRDGDTLYFYLFPGKKQFVKRLMGKPGDTIYFYGGRIYGIDREGRDISQELQLPRLASIDHIPFMKFEGNIKVSEPFHSSQGEAYRNTILHQMNEPVALLSVLSDHRLEGEMLSLRQIRNPDSPPIQEYGDLWGIKNYATARLLTSEQIKNTLKKIQWEGEEGPLFLELRHSPSLNSLKLGKDNWGRLRPRLQLSRSYIALNEEQLKALFSHLYTARFIVKNGFAMRYSLGEGVPSNTHFLPKMKGVPDGTYEFYDGIGYKIKWGGITSRLDKNHPLMKFSLDNLQMLFNLGIYFDTRAGSDQGDDWDTERFAYFRDGNLNVMGTTLLTANDPLLIDFVEREKEKQSTAMPQNPYTPFVDSGPPTLEMIKENGLLIPEEMYLTLGDNFAMSADSRDYGFVPAGNLRGSPSFIFWPPGRRFGPPNQPSTPWFTFPNVLIWGLAGVALVGWRIHHRRKYKLPLQFSHRDNEAHYGHL